MNKERRLGRGLAALLGDDEPVSVSAMSSVETATLRLHQPGDMNHYESPDVEDDDVADDEEPALATRVTTAPRQAMPEAATAKDGDLLLLGVTEIDDNPFQPRRDFSESELASLAESLKEHDMLQPILVRRMGDRWQLISGERRLRAAIKAGWSRVPARVRQADDRLVAELAIVENLQRKDLNAIEKAMSFRRYLDQHQCRQEDLAQRIKIDRSTIANLIRLLELPQRIQVSIQDGSISAGHARALLPLGDEQIQNDFADRIKREGWSVRDAERFVSEKIAEEDGDELSAPAKGRRRKSARPGHLVNLEQQFRMVLGSKVDIRQNTRGRGQIVIHFRSNDEFERLKKMIGESAQNQLERFAG
ncbi:MAG: ParB/RepB/Spo0J family partition protein [Planctomycetales bacterium]|nr:ParB/RepB/Spo0J family partition protein [Planctomycetales bacterium]